MKIASPIGRSVKEWIGKTPDSVPPPHVRVRIFDRWHGVCHITGSKIQVGDQWDLEHVIRLADRGENRERNMRPALRYPHREKTADETRRGRLADRQRQAHIGAKPAPQQKMQGRQFAMSDKTAKRVERASAKPALPPRQMFETMTDKEKSKPKPLAPIGATRTTAVLIPARKGGKTSAANLRPHVAAEILRGE